MNRRELIQLLTASVPAASLSVEVEKPIEIGDLVVIRTDQCMEYETAARLKAAVESIWPQGRSPKVLVLTDGLTLEVHRGVAKVQLQDA